MPRHLLGLGMDSNQKDGIHPAFLTIPTNNSKMISGS
ncbi:hypothetical protein J2X43_002971 [Rhizobium sp. BE258]|nr:hypothetical protein [Rhizobium sp. BE258]